MQTMFAAETTSVEQRPKRNAFAIWSSALWPGKLVCSKIPRAAVTWLVAASL